MPETIAILIPAAGASARMRGADKLLEPVDGVPLLRRQAEAALATGARVLVTLPPASPGRAAALDGLAATRLGVPDPTEGMAASIRLGAAAAGTAAGLMILLPDLPEIERADLARLIAAFRADPRRPILRATAADGTPGHPVLFPRDLLPALAEIRGDTGPRAVLAAHRDRLVDLPLAGRRAVTDLDTPEAWAAWRAATGR